MSGWLKKNRQKSYKFPKYKRYRWDISRFSASKNSHHVAELFYPQHILKLNDFLFASAISEKECRKQK